MKTSTPFKLFWTVLLAAFLAVPHPLWAATWDLRFTQLDGSSVPRQVTVTATANSVVAFASNQTVVSKAITGPGGVSVTHNNTNIVLGLANTAVTPGAYTNVNITVAADGRITAIENGTGGGGGDVPSTRTISTTSPLAGGGDFSANRTLTIGNAAADGSTKGAAAFTSGHFTAASGVVSLADSGVTAGTYGNSTHTPVIQVDAQGRVVVVTVEATAGGGGMGGNFTVSGNNVTSSGAVNILSSSNNNITLTPDGTGEVRVVGSANITGNLIVGGTMNLTTVNADTVNATNVTGPVFDNIVAGGTNVLSNSTGNFTMTASGFTITGNNTTKSAVFDLGLIPEPTQATAAIDVTVPFAIRTLTGNETATVSATPDDGRWISRLYLSPTTGYTMTLPAGTWKAVGADGTLTAITAVAVPADGYVHLTIRYDADTTTYYVWGYPFTAGGGSGTVDTSGTPASGQAAEFTDANTIAGVGVVGTGNYVKDTAPTISAATLTGVVTRDGATVLTPTTMGALVVNTSGINFKSVSANSTFTFSGAPAANTVFPLTITNSGGSELTHTIPSSLPWGVASGSPVTTVTHPANSTIKLVWEYNGSAYILAVLTAATSGGSVAVGDITGMGTGVATALAINVGSAGAPVVLNGALGTPSSGTLTNATGLPVASGISGLGTGIATALAVNTGSAGAPVLFNGAGGTPSSMTGTNITGTAAGLTAGTASAVAVGGITGLGTGVATAAAINISTTGSFVTSNATQTLTGKQNLVSGALGTDDTWDGNGITGLTAGATIAQWEAVYLGGSSTYLLADANGSGTYPAIGLAVAAYSSTNAAVVVTRGSVRNDAWAWTPGGTIYLSATAGGLTQTAPATTGDKVQVMGTALTADIMFVNPSSDYGTAP